MAFTHDVFLSYSSKDVETVRILAERLRARDLRVWFDQWEISWGDSIPARIEAGLEGSGILVLCMSANAFGSDWTFLESQTFRFRDPLNRERRFIPLRLDGTPPPGSLGQFRYADWRERDDAVIDQLASICRPPDDAPPGEPATPAAAVGTAPTTISLGHTGSICAVAYSPAGTHAITGSADHTARVWDLATGETIRVLEGHTGTVWRAAYSPDGAYAITGAGDGTARIWDVATGTTVHVLDGHTSGAASVAFSPDRIHAIAAWSGRHEVPIWNVATGATTSVLVGHTNGITAVAYSTDGTQAITGSVDATARVWDLATGTTTRLLDDGSTAIRAVAFNPDGTRALTSSSGGTVRVWDLATGAEIRVLTGHTDAVWTVAYGPDGASALTGSNDQTVRIWDVATGATIRVLEGHTNYVQVVAYSPDGTDAISSSSDQTVRVWDLATGTTTRILEGHRSDIRAVAYSVDGTHAITSSDDSTARIWDLATGTTTRVLEGHTAAVGTVAYSPDGARAITSSDDSTARVWDLATGTTTRVLEGHTGPVGTVAYSPDGAHAITGSADGTARVWDLGTGTTTRTLEGHPSEVLAVAYSVDGTHAITGAKDGTAAIWDVATGATTRILAGHTDAVRAVAYSPDGTRALTGSADSTIRVWDLGTGATSRVLEGHTGAVHALACSLAGAHAVTGSEDKTARVWDLGTGATTGILEGHSDAVVGVGWRQGGVAATVARNGVMRFWDVPERRTADDTVQYTNAKVVLVGESQAGKSGLAIRLATGDWRPTESTLGAWATQMLLADGDAPDGSEHREIWLWDFGGQADQQLIHQLYMSDAALAVLVFDGQRDDAVPRLWQWTHALRASAKDVPRLLVGARTDMYPMRIPDADIATIRDTAGYHTYLGTSAKTGAGCDTLRDAIVDGIDWSTIPWRSTPRIFQRLRGAILALKDKGRVLVSAKDLHDVLPLDVGPFTADQLDAVIGLLAGPGAVMALGFGDWVLLQPELLNTYAQAVIYTLRSDPEERGCISEERVLKGDLDYPPGLARLPEGDETIVLLAMHKQLVERELCFRDHDADEGRAAQLIFPSYFRRDRVDRPTAPATLVSYHFQGSLDVVYASLVTRLHRSDSFASGDLWRDAADFRGPTGAQIGVRLTRLDDGQGRLDIYYDQLPPPGDQVLFDRHVDEHLRRTATHVQRQRTYRCPNCGIAPAADAVQRRRANGLAFIRCNACEQEPEIRFLDDLERRFTDAQNLAAVTRDRDAAQVRLDSESLERQLVGEAYTIVASAGQIAREIVVSDWGLDMEVEFKDDEGRPTGRRVWLQLKSGDSHLRHRRRDDARLFRVNARHADYWADQPEPVHLVIRDGQGRIEAMDVRAELRRLREAQPWPPAELRFVGERFDVMCVRRWREQALDLPRS